MMQDWIEKEGMQEKEMGEMLCLDALALLFLAFFTFSCYLLLILIPDLKKFDCQEAINFPSDELVEY